MNIAFTSLESLRSDTSPGSLSKKQLWGPKHHTKGVDQWKLRPADILAFFLYVYIHIQICFNRIIYQVTDLNISTEHQTFFDLCPTKAAL